MRAVVEGRLSADSDAFGTHIDRCLGCRACEPACPSGVEYGALLELARATRTAGARNPLITIILSVVSRKSLRLPAMFAARVTRALGLPALVGRRGGKGAPGALRLGAAMLAASAPARLGVTGTERGRGTKTEDASNRGVDSTGASAAGHEHSSTATSSQPGEPATGARGTARGTARGAIEASRLPRHRTRPGPGIREATRGTVESPGSAVEPDAHARSVRRRGNRGRPQRGDRGRVALLSGCVQAGLFGRVRAASARTLATNGYSVVQAHGQGCCGALHAHAGSLAAARSLARANIEAFDATGADWIAVDASGCGSAMKDYPEHFRDDPVWLDRASALAAKVKDVTELLALSGPRPGAALPAVAAYDHPCHLLHAQGVRDAPLKVLAGIPELEVRVVEDAEECCGGAGIYGITQRELGWRIGCDKAESVRSSGADLVTTPNPGCSMQIGAVLRLAGHPLPVAHPVELLDESYRRAGYYDQHHLQTSIS